jgi:hypothetical protein|eukprot:COSAG06_NODE_1982_length_7921_cov_162.133086_7_plen_130_part_00
MTGAQACSASTKRFLRFSAFYDAFVLSLSWQLLALLFSNREIPDRKSRERKKKKRKEKHFDSHAHFILKMIILPRQARDKLGNTPKREMRFLIVYLEEVVLKEVVRVLLRVRAAKELDQGLGVPDEPAR